MSEQNRQPRGTPIGGQFGSTPRSESDISLRAERNAAAEDDVEVLADAARGYLAEHPGELGPFRVAEALRGVGRPVTDSTVLAVYDRLRAEDAAEKTVDPRLIALAEHEDPRVRAAVAFNPAVPLSMLRRLAEQDPSPDLDQAIARNPNADADLLEALRARATVGASGPLDAIASHPNTSPHTLTAMATGPNTPAAVKRGILRRPDVDAATIAHLVNDSNTEVSIAALAAIRALGLN